MKIDLKNKSTLLITGGSRGIGAQVAMQAFKKYNIALNYRSNTLAAEKLSKQIEIAGGNIRSYQADISNEEQTKFMFNLIFDDFGPVSHLVNNAGILKKKSNFESISNTRFESTFSTNIFGVINCTRFAIEHMKKLPLKKDKSIVNISSGAAKNGAPNQYIDYAMSKAAIDSFSIGLATELAKHNIRVNLVKPGFIDTDIHENKNRLFEVLDRIPMNRIGKTEEVANGILWLLSDQASYVTGSSLDIAGGK